ncbi:hypothetical protein MKX01_004595 [Papaver californicum]|nr:hypothetical protein MKX01_004595 [Papaver californicum]
MASLFFTRFIRVYTYSSSTKSSLSSSLTIYNECRRNFRSKAALESLITTAENTPNLILYNIPSYSGSYSAFFAHLCCAVDTCYLLDYVGPKGFLLNYLSLEFDPTSLITRGNAYISPLQNAANKLLYKPFKIHLELCLRSAAAGLRPIGAVVYMQRKISRCACAYGGGDTSASSSLIIRMEEYSQWISGRSHKVCRYETFTNIVY